MINFFRQVRHRLLKQNNISRYLFYAIGEIILVVLGILIALKINGIHNHRTNERLEIKYLTAIADNINADVKDLRARIAKDSLHLDAYTQLVRAFTVDSIRADESTLKDIIHNSAIINYFNPQNAVFDEMKASGNLSLIQSSPLKFGIMEYYNRSNKVVSSQEINNSYILKHKANSIDSHLDMNSMIESKLPEQWRAELSPFDDSFFDKNSSDIETENFARHISLMKAAVWINYRWKKGLLEYAENTKLNIEQYLANK